MLTVHLHQLLFHGYHGIYPGEELIGNNFEVSLDVSYEAEREKMDDIAFLISYEDLYKIVQQRMSTPTPLLEELANGIMHKIKHRYTQVASIQITIFKLQAPIENFQGKVGISFFQKFDA
ncbi:dihydroneopterin aldolase [Flavihumibacter fluvii]|uniref:dihydroneopterin aldolase n=1 Tax=Flavihumibacter fluvii TaxID=2838157 RepID=UPI001BDEE097|nr:dihydroneopterin aldolase [Flavihumibacter fluvii]ULQ54206.1 dihydroneopterin aldolase [Flavihumibacter fluvii]